MPPLPILEDDRNVDTAIGVLLRIGVLLAAVLLLIGGGVYLVHHGWEPKPDRATFVPQPEKYERPGEMLAAAHSGQGRALIALGIVALIATPILRVLFAALAFAWRRDWTYVVVPLIVLAVLIAGLLSGQTH
jgi:uncharacterized membrane protein